MLTTEAILFFSVGYIGLLFAIAYVGDKHAEIGRSIVSNSYIYALSLAVYCTAWTFYGSVGRAATDGLGFLPTYIGPTLVATLGWWVLRKIIRISKVQRITSIADFVASRYGKSTVLGSTVTIIAVLGIVPYISLQLKAISTSYLIIKQFPQIGMPIHFADIPVLEDTSFYIALMLAAFTILFGTRHLEATERHEGLVAAIAFESIVKLIAFLMVGVYVTFGMFDGFGDIVARARAIDELRDVFTLPSSGGVYVNWWIHICLSMMAVMFLPRQFQIMVVENDDENHLNKAIWLFPLYLLAINIFVLPIAFGGVIYFGFGSIDADTFVLTLPLAENKEALTLFVFIGGISAATGMVIVATIALSTMISNDLVMPVLLRLSRPQLAQRSDISGTILSIRRGSIVMVLILAYAYFHYVGEFYTLVSIGLISFTAVSQFAPAILGGIFWKRGTRYGVLAGMLAGFAIWAYTLVLPSMVQAGLVSSQFITQGPFGLEFLKPFELFGFQDLDHVAHAVFWSLLINTALYVGVSIFTPQNAIEHSQATLFVDVFKYAGSDTAFWRGTASVDDLRKLLERFLGKRRAHNALSDFTHQHQINWKHASMANPDLVSHVEKLLAGVIGSSSARVAVGSVSKEEPLGIEEVMNILEETREAIAYSRELEKATAELQAANDQLKELDRLKDEFISTVTHELRTPLTSIRSIAEILHANPKISGNTHQDFIRIIVKESVRLSRLINQVLDFQKIKTGRMDWQSAPLNLIDVIHDAVQATDQLVREKQIQLNLYLPDKAPIITGDNDKIIQVLVNLISNAVKFCEPQRGRIDIRLEVGFRQLHLAVADNGIGIQEKDREKVFEEFRQVSSRAQGRPSGSGLGLAITRRIIEYHGGKIWVDGNADGGATFFFTLPYSRSSQ